MLFFGGHLIVSRPLILFLALLSSKQVICVHVVYLRCIALVFYFYSNFYSIDLTNYCPFNSIESASFQVSYRKRSATLRCYEKSDHQKSSLRSLPKHWKTSAFHEYWSGSLHKNENIIYPRLRGFGKPPSDFSGEFHLWKDEQVIFNKKDAQVLTA